MERNSNTGAAEQPQPRGQVLGGEAGVRLSHDPETTVGIDVVYVSAEVIVQQTDETTLIDGVPTLAVEILSPNDTIEEIHDKMTTYRLAGVPLVWMLRSVQPHRDGPSSGRRAGVVQRPSGVDRRAAPAGFPRAGRPAVRVTTALDPIGYQSGDSPKERSLLMATVATPMTTKEMLALPENGMERWLIAGELRERPMTVRNRFHSRVMACVTTELELWLRQQSPPRGQVRCGEAGCRLRRDPDTTVGIDVVSTFRQR